MPLVTQTKQVAMTDFERKKADFTFRSKDEAINFLKTEMRLELRSVRTRGEDEPVPVSMVANALEDFLATLEANF